MADVPPQGDESPLGRVHRKLYGMSDIRENPVAVAPAPAPVDATVPGWQPEPSPKRSLSVTAWFFIVAVGFFILAGIAAGLILLLGGRSVGNDRMIVRFEGPVAVDGGEAVPFDVVIENGNPVVASDITLSIDFPEGAFAADTKEPLGHYTVKVEDLQPGESARESVEVVYFGPENQHLSVPVEVEYKTPNSSATFVKEATQELSIATAPLSIRTTVTPEISSGQRFTMTVSVRSNAPDTLKDVALKVEYPFGFSATETVPAPRNGNVFSLGDLDPGEEAEVKITGSLTGQDGEERVFRFEGGVLADAEGSTLRTPAYTSGDADVTITRSFLATTLTLNQENGDLVAHAGDDVQGMISWVNALASTITDGELRVALSGDAIDLGTVVVTNGMYRSSDHTIVFDETTEQGLRSIAPGASGAGAFRFSLKEGSALKSPSATLTVSVSGRRAAEGGRQETLTSSVTRAIKVASDLTLEASAVHNSGPFENSGPLPPEPNKETTYTVKWSVANSVNTVANAVVTATLPSYVRFTGVANPSSGITYNEVTRTVTWSLGDVAPGVVREGAFQIGFTPSTSQSGGAPVLVDDQEVNGFDRFSQAAVSAEAGVLTTELQGDSGFNSADGRVK